MSEKLTIQYKLECCCDDPNHDARFERFGVFIASTRIGCDQMAMQDGWVQIWKSGKHGHCNSCPTCSSDRAIKNGAMEVFRRRTLAGLLLPREQKGELK